MVSAETIKNAAEIMVEASGYRLQVFDFGFASSIRLVIIVASSNAALLCSLC
jgi:hypothetical protein